MANPFLVLGGIAVGVVTAAFGVLQVPGWVASAQDAAAINDLANIRDSQAVLRSTNGTFTADFPTLSGKPVAFGGDVDDSTLALARGGSLGAFAPMSLPTNDDKTRQITFELSPGTKLAHLGANVAGDAYCAVVQSGSGNFFAVAEGQEMSKASNTEADAMDGAHCAPDTRPAPDPGEETPGEPEVPEEPGEETPEVPAEPEDPYRQNQIVFRVDTTLEGCGKPGVQLGYLRNPVTISWGDGATSAGVGGANVHAYDVPGVYDIVFEGTVDKFEMMSPTSQPCLTEVTWWGKDVTTNASDIFASATNLTQTVAPPTTVTSAARMFSGATSFNQNINDWDVSNIAIMTAMFSNTTFNQPLDKWDMSGTTDTRMMFYNSPFNQPLAAWDTGSITTMATMFANTPFNQPIGNWNTGQVRSFSEMFQNNKAFNQNISGWNTSNATDMSRMFKLTGAFNQPIGKWDTSKVTTLEGTFASAGAFNQAIGQWNTTSVKSMQETFLTNKVFTADVSAWNTSKVTTMRSMFKDSVNPSNLSKWNVAAVTNSRDFALNGQLTGTPAFK